MQKRILIIDSISTGKNYIEDVYKRGYEPVVMYHRLEENAEPLIRIEKENVKKQYEHIAHFFDELDTYEETLAYVKSLDPILIVAGYDASVEIAMQLSNDLNLPSSDYSKINSFVNKDAMQLALKEHGLRYIRGKIVHSTEEALAYYREEHLKGCVIKPSRGAASVGVRLCDDEESLKEALEEVFKSYSVFGNEIKDCLLQERISGTEYIVNTISYKGTTRMVSMWQYKKKKVAGGGNVYDYILSKNKLTVGDHRIVQYALDVAKALGYENGPIHGEYMVDEQGPVLIEANCRIMGATMPAEYVDKIFTHHETDEVLDTFLSPTYHEKRMLDLYRPIGYGAIKFFIIKEDSKLETAPILPIVTRLRSYCFGKIGGFVRGEFKRTVDLETSGGTIYLAHSDEAVLKHDLDFLDLLESQYSQMLFGSYIDFDTSILSNVETVEEVYQKCGCHKSVLIFSNDNSLNMNAKVVNVDSIKEVGSNYNYAILDLNYQENEDIEMMIEDFYRVVDKVKIGGQIIVPKRTYCHFPNGVESIEILSEALGLTIEAPMYGLEDIVIITK